MIKLNEDSERDTLIIIYKGTITIQDLVGDIHDDLTFLKKSRYGSVLIDFSQAEMKFGIKQLDQISEKIIEFRGDFTSLKIAVIITQPIPTAMMLLIENSVCEETIWFRIFSSIDTAKEWLEIV